MVYIEIIYLILYSMICFLVVRNIHRDKVNEIYNDYVSKLESLDIKFGELQKANESTLNESRKNIAKQNSQYLSEIDKNVSKRLKELSDSIKNRPII